MLFNSDEIKETLVRGLSALGIKLDEVIIDKVTAYFKLLLEKNRVVNLISPKQDIMTQTIVHLVDSLSLLQYEKLPRNISALDFGSGGGLPAIPLSLALADWRYTLVESTGKKAAFLSAVKSELNLVNVDIMNRFLEPGLNRENIVYDIITARAVTETAKLLSIAAPRLKQGGLFIAFKGPRGDLELSDCTKELKKDKMCLVDKLDFILPELSAKRSLFIFEKR